MSLKPSRSALLVVSALLFVVILAGGMAMKAGAGENNFRQAVLFTEVMSLVMDNYVDPVDADALLGGAYEGMLGGLDSNGAYLSPDEVRRWKAYSQEAASGDPGISVLKSGRSLQIVAVAEGSPAAQADLKVGDQIRAVDGTRVRDLSLAQAQRRIRGVSGSTVRLDVLHPQDGFRRDELELARKLPVGPAYVIEVRQGTAVLRPLDLSRIKAEELRVELDEVRSRGVERLLVDLRNVADTQPRNMVPTGELFVSGTLLVLRDSSGQILETHGSSAARPAWSGEVATLVNGATAGGGEALARLLRSQRESVVLGESTYGFGSEVSLFELEDGAGLLVSSALWEDGAGHGWNDDGIDPDETIHGKGADYPTAAADQLQRALDFLDAAAAVEPVAEAA